MRTVIYREGAGEGLHRRQQGDGRRLLECGTGNCREAGWGGPSQVWRWPYQGAFAQVDGGVRPRIHRGELTVYAPCLSCLPELSHIV